jgi:AIG2-like family
MSSARLNSPKRLDKRARQPFRAQLDGWGIRFDLYSKCNDCGVTNIVQSESEYVMGVVYKVPGRLVCAPRGRLSKMDEIEGVRLDGTGNYERKRINVVNGRGEKISVATYIGTEHGQRRFLRTDELERRVSRTYFSYLLTGANKFRFSENYILYLRRQVGILKG